MQNFQLCYIFLDKVRETITKVMATSITLYIDKSMTTIHFNVSYYDETENFENIC